MKAYKCDICGNLYEDKKGVSLKGKSIKCYIFEQYNESNICCVDICPDCISAIQDLIDERSKENE